MAVLFSRIRMLRLSIYEELDFVEDILQHNQDVIVIVDEAYIDFAGKSAMELIDRYDNLIVVQTFRKLVLWQECVLVCHQQSDLDQISQ